MIHTLNEYTTLYNFTGDNESPIQKLEMGFFKRNRGSLLFHADNLINAGYECNSLYGVFNMYKMVHKLQTIQGKEQDLYHIRLVFLIGSYELFAELQVNTKQYNEDPAKTWFDLQTPKDTSKYLALDNGWILQWEDALNHLSRLNLMETWIQGLSFIAAYYKLMDKEGLELSYEETRNMDKLYEVLKDLTHLMEAPGKLDFLYHSQNIAQAISDKMHRLYY
jgi:hypothetical protein